MTKLRVERAGHLTPTAASRKAGFPLPYSRFADVESGRTLPSMDTLHRICRFLDCCPRELFDLPAGGEHLLHLRVFQDLTREQVAMAARIPVATYMSLERGVVVNARRMYTAAWRRLARALDVTEEQARKGWRNSYRQAREAARTSA